MSRFTWGKVIDRFEYDFDGVTMEVTKYHPRKSVGVTVTQEIDESKVEYHCEELREAANSVFELLISFIARKKLGYNQHALVAGVCRALDLTGEKS